MRNIVSCQYGLLTSMLVTLLGVPLARAEPAGPPVLASFDEKGDLEGFAYTSECRLENPGEGGNPGGYLKSACLEAFGGTFLAGADTERADLTGDRRFRIWTVNFDLQVFEGRPTGVFLRFRNRAQEGWLLNGWRYRFATPLSGEWIRFSVTFDPGWTDAQARANGWQKDFADGAFSPSWADNMSRIGTAEVRVEALEPLVIGIDNYTLIPVPWT